MRSRSRGTLESNPGQEDDELVELPPPGSLANLHPPSHLNRQSQSSGTSSTLTMNYRRGSGETYNGGGGGSTVSGGSNRSSGHSTATYWDIVKPVVTVRAEHPSVERSLDRDKKQYLTCMVSVEMPSRWPTAPPLLDNSPFDDPNSPVSSLPPPSTSSNLARSNSSLRSAPRSASPTPSSTYSAYAFGSTNPTSSTQLMSVVDDLQKRMADWKGHSLGEFGGLKLYDYINVRKETASREFLVYVSHSLLFHADVETDFA